ncbi:MAG: UvrB/UvrC motif-containing protein [Longimicrobiales bacterium]|nr:UvrB/UvrC motif-containing protein [Longimicrobiales bacterium]
MKCESCGEHDAVVHLTQIENNDMKVVHLCEACAAEEGLDTPSAAAAQPLAGFLAEMSGETAPRHGSDSARCPFCGLTFTEFRETGRFGCSQCWTTFEAQVQGLLRRVHGATTHIGKVYLPPDPTASEREKRLQALRRRLERAVELEDFERAAELRDEIRAFEPSA